MKLKLLILIFLPMVIYPSPFAYVVNEGSDTVTPIDLATNTTLSPITVGASPSDIAITPNNKTAYVTNLTSANVTPINIATNTPGTNIELPTGAQPVAIAIRPNGLTAYAVDQFNDAVDIINIATNSVIGSIDINATSAEPVDIAITPDGTTAYISDGFGVITIINLNSNTVIGSISVGGASFAGLQVTPNGKTLYVVDTGGGDKVYPITVGTNAVGSPITVGADPLDIAITPDSTIGYVTNHTGNSISVLNLTNNTVNTTISNFGAGPADVAITSDGSEGVVTLATADTARILLIASNTGGAIIPVEVDPVAVAITPQPFPPSAFTGTLKKNKFLNTTECVVVASFTPSPSSTVAFYRIYQNGIVVLETTSTSPNICLDCDTGFGNVTVTAVGANGVESSQVPLVIF